MASCIGCGCTELRACIDLRTGRGCAWVRLDGEGRGVCSQCRELVEAWDGGHRGHAHCPACARIFLRSTGDLAHDAHELGAIECPGCELLLGVVFAAGDEVSWASEWSAEARAELAAASARVLLQRRLMLGHVPGSLVV